MACRDWMSVYRKRHWRRFATMQLPIGMTAITGMQIIHNISQNTYLHLLHWCKACLSLAEWTSTRIGCPFLAATYRRVILIWIRIKQRPRFYALHMHNISMYMSRRGIQNTFYFSAVACTTILMPGHMSSAKNSGSSSHESWIKWTPSCRSTASVPTKVEI